MTWNIQVGISIWKTIKLNISEQRRWRWRLIIYPFSRYWFTIYCAKNLHNTKNRCVPKNNFTCIAFINLCAGSASHNKNRCPIKPSMKFICLGKNTTIFQITHKKESVFTSWSSFSPNYSFNKTGNFLQTSKRPM